MSATCVMEALSLIARLEDRKLDQLNNEVMDTEEKLRVSAMAMETHWTHYLYDYVTKGAFESGLRAVRDAPFFEDLPGECLTNLIPSAGLWSGWDIMKNIGFLSRPQRRRLVSSKRWVVHLFAGKEGHLDQGDTTVLELDLDRCAGQDLVRNEVWRMLLWGAKEGKVDVILGGPPGRAHQLLKGGKRDIKSLALVARMMWLYVVAQVGREVNGGGINKDRDVGFVLEYPEGMTAQQKRDRELSVLQAEGRMRDPSGRAGGASWEQSQDYWEEVQKPRWEDWVGTCAVDASRGFWQTRMWKSFAREAELCEVSFDQGAMGSKSRNRTTLGTNVYSLVSLSEVRVADDADLPERGDEDYIWSSGLVNALVVGLNFWERNSKCAPRMRAMSPLQWKQHIDSNHAVYKKECATCVMGRGLGRQHRRVHHPETYVLTADVAGPLTPGLDATSKGTMGKGLKYLLAAKYLVPRAKVEAYSGKTPPADDGQDCEAPLPLPGQEPPLADEDLFGDLFGTEPELDKAIRGVEVAEFPDDEELFPLESYDEYEPSDPGEEEEVAPDDGREGQPDVEEELSKPQKVDNILMQEGDTVAPEMTFLVFATALPNNQSKTQFVQLCRLF